MAGMVSDQLLGTRQSKNGVKGEKMGQNMYRWDWKKNRVKPKLTHVFTNLTMSLKRPLQRKIIVVRSRRNFARSSALTGKYLFHERNFSVIFHLMVRHINLEILL